jgi:GNAT superfamily N-acetyltransferase
MKLSYRQIGSASNRQESKLFVDAYLRLFNDPENLPFLSVTGIPFKRETVETWLREADAAGIEYHAAVGEDGGIHAIMVVREHPVDAFEVLGIVVEEGYRRMSIGARLLETAVRRAKEKGYRAVSVAVFANNKKMLLLAVQQDFKPVGIEYHAKWNGEDIVHLKRYLA